MSQVFDKTLRSLQTATRMRELKQNMLSANVANAETPGYKAQKLDFEEQLKSALRAEEAAVASGEAHILNSEGAVSEVKPEIYDNPEVELSNDGNTVDLEREMAEMAQNDLMYRATTQLISKKLGALKYAANDGSR